MIPATVRAGQVLALVEIVGSFGGRIDAPKLADELGGDIAFLLPILDTAEMLGLVRNERGDIFLTDSGLKFQKASKGKVRQLGDRLAKFEPFRTAIELAKKKGAFTPGALAEALARKGFQWHHDKELNETLVQKLLINWAIGAELLKYDGKSGKFMPY